MRAKWRTLNLLFGKCSNLAQSLLDNVELYASSFNDVIIWPIFDKQKHLKKVTETQK